MFHQKTGISSKLASVANKALERLLDTNILTNKMKIA